MPAHQSLRGPSFYPHPPFEQGSSVGKPGWQLGPLPYLLLLLILFPLSQLGQAQAAAGGSWQPPVSQPLEVLTPFERPAAFWSSGHRGVDLALEAGQAVLAPQEGQVVFSGWVVDRQVLTLRHPDGTLSSFEPLDQPLPAGSQVQAGQPLALLAADQPHCPTRFCLHWGVRQPFEGRGSAGPGLEYINPLSLLGLEGPSVLLPLGQDFSA